MTDYAPPIKDMLFNIRELSGTEEVLALDAYADFDLDLIEQVVEEAGKFSAEVLGPLNIPGDQVGSIEITGIIGLALGIGNRVKHALDGVYSCAGSI